MIDADTPKLAGDLPEASESATVETQAVPRRMPDEVRKHLIHLRDGVLYLPSAARVLWFRMEHPDWTILTDLVEGGYHLGYATVRATVLTDRSRPIATGLKTESKAEFPAGWVEKAETGAVGRALAMAGYGTQFAPELDTTAPDDPAPTKTVRRPVHAARRGQKQEHIWDGPGLCPDCHAPPGKPHAGRCRR